MKKSSKQAVAAFLMTVLVVVISSLYVDNLPNKFYQGYERNIIATAKATNFVDSLISLDKAIHYLEDNHIKKLPFYLSKDKKAEVNVFYQNLLNARGEIQDLYDHISAFNGTDSEAIKDILGENLVFFEDGYVVGFKVPDGIRYFLW